MKAIHVGFFIFGVIVGLLSASMIWYDQYRDLLPINLP